MLRNAVAWVWPGNNPCFGLLMNPALHPQWPDRFDYTEGRKRVGAAVSWYGPLACSTSVRMPASIPAYQADARL